MISLGVRLAVAAGREALVRFLIIAAAVAIGVGLLLATVGSVNALTKQTSRDAWLNTGIADTAATSAAPLWWSIREDRWHGTAVGRVDVAATGSTSPVPPGIPRLPAAGEFYASPAMTALLRDVPADQLADRYPGRQVGTIADVGLPSPDSLIIVIGRTPTEMAHQRTAVKVTSIQGTKTTDCSGCQVGLRAAGLDLVLGVVAGAMLFPVLMLIGTSTRLAAARREERFAAMRLIGATPRQISLLAAVESTLSAVAGTVVGFALFLLLRHQIAAIPFTGEPYFASDVTVGPLACGLIAVGVPLAAAVAAMVTLRRVNISPLGVTRRVTPRAPRAYRLIPLVVGLLELSVFLVVRKPESSLAQTEAFLPGFLIVMSGLVIAGPWLTMVGSRVLSRRTGRADALIAARRLADNPRAGFRGVSGLILALFVTTVATGVITTIVDHRGAPVTGPGVADMIQQFPYPGGVPNVAEGTVAQLRAVAGVTDVILTRRVPFDPAHPDRLTPYALSGGSIDPRNTPDALVPCDVLDRHPDIGVCEPGARFAGVFDDLQIPDGFRLGPHTGPVVWPTAEITTEQFDALPVGTLVATTDGTHPALERIRTALAGAFGDLDPANTEAEWAADSASTLNQWKQLANVVVLTSLAIAGCSLAVSVVSGLNDRKRPFSMLRLTGVPLATLRRVVALETAVPLLVAAVISVGVAMLAANLFLRAQMDYTLDPPGLTYGLVVAAGLLMSLGIVASTFPLLRRVTGPETARND